MYAIDKTQIINNSNFETSYLTHKNTNVFLHYFPEKPLTQWNKNSNKKVCKYSILFVNSMRFLKKWNIILVLSENQLFWIDVYRRCSHFLFRISNSFMLKRESALICFTKSSNVDKQEIQIMNKTKNIVQIIKVVREKNNFCYLNFFRN